LYLINEDVVRLFKKVFGREEEDGEEDASVRGLPVSHSPEGDGW
jgi:hypothetical protein